MKYFILVILLVVPTQTFASEIVTTTGLSTTELDFVWNIKTKESAWSGKLDCQSFFHYIKFSDSKKDINQYLDAQECDDLHDQLIKGNALTPICMKVGSEVGIEKVDCNFSLKPAKKIP